MADVYCHCIIRSDRILIPDALINLVDRKYFSLILHQQQKNVILDRGKLHHFAIHRHFLQIVIDAQTANCINTVTGFCCISKLRIAAELGFHPCHQFQRIERFLHIIVRPDIQS